MYLLCRKQIGTEKVLQKFVFFSKSELFVMSFKFKNHILFNYTANPKFQVAYPNVIQHKTREGWFCPGGVTVIILNFCTKQITQKHIKRQISGFYLTNSQLVILPWALKIHIFNKHNN